MTAVICKTSQERRDVFLTSSYRIRPELAINFCFKVNLSLLFSSFIPHTMESLAETVWDVVICGTGLQQSLLAFPGGS
ncbi:hypothetical protein HYQ46_006039 [Verticillium longisporum]|nr:hypothetical protein HYQ46_006039 [Verticillium longisporum]